MILIAALIVFLLPLYMVSRCRDTAAVVHGTSGRGLSQRHIEMISFGFISAAAVIVLAFCNYPRVYHHQWVARNFVGIFDPAPQGSRGGGGIYPAIIGTTARVYQRHSHRPSPWGGRGLQFTLWSTHGKDASPGLSGPELTCSTALLPLFLACSGLHSSSSLSRSVCRCFPGR